MSYESAGPLVWYPSGGAGVSMTPSGTAWTNPAAWTTVIPSADRSLAIAHLAIDAPTMAAMNEFEIDIARGIAGEEVRLLTYAGTIIAGGTDNAPIVVRIPIPLVGVGDRVASRIRLSTTEVTAWLIKLGYYGLSTYASDQLASQPLECLPSNADGLSLPLGGSPAWTVPAWTTLTSGFASPVLIVGGTTKDVSSTDFELEIGIGAGPTLIGRIHGLGGAAGMPGYDLPRPIAIDAGVPVSLRLRGEQHVRGQRARETPLSRCGD